MSEDILKQYKRLAEDRVSESNPEMWDRIEETLELDKGWDRIDASLRRRKRSPVILMCLITGLLMLISVFGYFKFDSTPSPSSGIVHAENPASGLTEDNSGSDNKYSGKSDLYPADNSPKNSADNTVLHVINGVQATIANNNRGYSSSNETTKHNSSPALNFNVADSIETASKSELIQEHITTARKDSQSKESFICFSTIPARSIASPNSSVVHKVNELPQKGSSVMYLISALGARGTIFLNSHTSKAIRNESFEYVNMKPSSSLQVGVGTELHGQWMIESRVHLNNQGGQSVHYLSEGKSVFADTRLKYTSLEISAGRYLNHSESPRMRWICTSWQAGAYISFLQDVNVYTNSSSELSNSEFKSTDYGLILRYNIHKRIGSFDIVAGTFSSFGLHNIAKTKPGVPDYFNRCYNVAAGLNIGCKYFF